MPDYQLYLDDVRNPPGPPQWMVNDHPDLRIGTTWVVARSFDDAVKHIKKEGMPYHISFDHDLGYNVPTGYDFAKWIVESVLDGDLEIPEGFTFEVHSMNPVGKKNIYMLIKNFLSQLDQ